jgi:hypothetical protein
MRTINAAAELDEADMRVDGQEVSRFGSDEATRYASVPPGRHDLSITRPGGEGGALAAAQHVPLVAGSASTAIVVGSRGEPAQVLLVSDQTAGPSVAPATGFLGDTEDGSGWLLVLLAAVAAGWLGGTSYLLSARRRTGATFPASRIVDAPQFPPARLRPLAPPPLGRPSSAEPVPDRSWALAAVAALAAGSLGRLLYKAGRRRRRGA